MLSRAPDSFAPCPDSQFSGDLLSWYDRSARQLPWRIDPHLGKAGQLPDPYHIWLSEVMLQQTTVATVGAYYAKFLENWPNVRDLAAASQDDVLKAWAGLGYYSRARNLAACAKQVVELHGGVFPRELRDLLSLKGIGDYTANAIRAIAFNLAAAPIDGNIKRVIARQFLMRAPPDEIKAEIAGFYRDIADDQRPGDFVQAMMDLGATICTPTKPKCEICPVSNHCRAFARNAQNELPAKAARKAKPHRRGVAFVILRRRDGAIFLRKRADKGLLGGMSEVPGTIWAEDANTALDDMAIPIAGAWEPCGAVTHVFTHFHLELGVFKIITDRHDDSNGWWSKPDDIAGEALPTIMKKVIAAAITSEFRPQKVGE